jgi:hypothetical protein
MGTRASETPGTPRNHTEFPWPPPMRLFNLSDAIRYKNPQLHALDGELSRRQLLTSQLFSVTSEYSRQSLPFMAHAVHNGCQNNAATLEIKIAQFKIITDDSGIDPESFEC